MTTTMIELPTKPRITVDAERGDYAMRFVLYHRRSWKKMSLQERIEVLRQSADTLTTYAEQMRAEAEQLMT